MTAAAADVHRAAELADVELIRRSLTEPEWFAALFDRHGRRIYDYAARRLGAQAAEDIVAETFFVAFRRRAAYDTAQTLARPWLYGIATNLIAKHRRVEERHYRTLRRTGLDPVPEPLAETVVRRVAAEAEDRRLAEAMASLHRRDRDVLLLVAWADLTYEEVAAALGVPVGTVRSRLNRARRRIRAAFGDTDPTAEES
ncbi:RNA polymerase sigma factor [Actinomadura kijaniata]|uniref:RNA polymerase sigma-70 factor (ECF subfamily) n=1 Tax=Actinomadura namibiensis TaxID=182080 RepID=A0A7W3LTZ2_ACTNM|nr:RNA polymerase sigma factor [Actinomadura namibiensis]MBA8954245.1 RNA polymerase sigma-70 factor (ECF subfamily) [Actinomadura namibiensis]